MLTTRHSFYHSLLEAFFLLLIVLFASPARALSDEKVEPLQHGYSRKGDFIYFDGRRIDQAGREDFKKFTQVLGYSPNMCSKVDAASFQALSVEYTKDKNMVYYRWISPGKFWVVEIPEADPASFEVAAFNLARDKTHVFWYGRSLKGLDPATLEVVNEGFVWKDGKGVWYQHQQIEGADPKSFEHLQQAFYRDAKRVYWSSTPLKGANPKTFRTFGNDIAFGADEKQVWFGKNPVIGVDAPTFVGLHQRVFKDKNSVFSAPETRIAHADPLSFKKVADLDEHYTALFADKDRYYIYLPYRGEVYVAELTEDSLRISRPIMRAHKNEAPQQVALSVAELAKGRWVKQQVTPDPKIPGRDIQLEEAHILKIYLDHFIKAWKLIQKREKKIPTPAPQ